MSASSTTSRTTNSVTGAPESAVTEAPFAADGNQEASQDAQTLETTKSDSSSGSSSNILGGTITTSQQSPSVVILSVKPTMLGSPRTQRFGRRDHQKRQTDSGFVGQGDDQITHSCSDALRFRQGGGQLQRRGRAISVDPGVRYVKLTDYPDGSISTVSPSTSASSSPESVSVDISSSSSPLTTDFLSSSVSTSEVAGSPKPTLTTSNSASSGFPIAPSSLRTDSTSSVLISETSSPP